MINRVMIPSSGLVGASSRLGALSVSEAPYYKSLFQMAGPDQNSGSAISGAAAASFLQKSGLSRPVLRAVWTASDIYERGYLDEESFQVACRLVAHAQAGGPPESFPQLSSVEPPTLPIFDINREEDHRSLVSDARSIPFSVDVPGLINNGYGTKGSVMDNEELEELRKSMKDLGLDPMDIRSRKPLADEGGLSTKKLESPWRISPEDKVKYTKVFMSFDTKKSGYVPGRVAKQVLEKSQLSSALLGQVWELADEDKDGSLSFPEFLVAMHLVSMIKKGHALPGRLPKDLEEVLKGESSKDLPSPKSAQEDKRSSPPPNVGTSESLADRIKKQQPAMSTPSPSPSPSPPKEELMKTSSFGGRDWRTSFAPESFGERFRSQEEKDERTPPPAQTMPALRAGEEGGGEEEAERKMANWLDRDIEFYSDELSRLQELCAQADRQCASLEGSIQQKSSQKEEVARQSEELKERLQESAEEKRQLNSDRVSVKRDRVHMQEELEYLRNTVDVTRKDLALLRESLATLEAQVQKTESHCRSLDLERREASRKHQGELEKLRMEEEQLAALRKEFQELKRDEEAAKVHEIAMKRKEAARLSMQTPLPESRVELGQGRWRERDVLTEDSLKNSWAQRIGSREEKKGSGVNFGKGFFEGRQNKKEYDPAK